MAITELVIRKEKKKKQGDRNDGHWQEITASRKYIFHRKSLCQRNISKGRLPSF